MAEGLDSFEPTPVAIRKHIAALKERAIKSSKVLSKPATASSASSDLGSVKARQGKQVKSTRSKATGQSRATTSRKRKRRPNSDDEDDEPEPDPITSDDGDMTDRETDEELDLDLDTTRSGGRRFSNRVIKPSSAATQAETEPQLTDEEDDLTDSAASNYSAAAHEADED